MHTGRESTLALVERSESVIYSDPRNDENTSQQSQSEVNDSVLLSNKQLDISQEVITPNDLNVPRRSLREKRPPAKYKNYVSC